MTTKLVYVLTCSLDKFYIEQALIAVFSARHWNPDACIVLMVDDKTDALLQGKRAEILEYVSEKIVIPFEDASLSPMYRSRWIKTSVRQLVKGDFLFVDCDTIVCRSLDGIDNFDCTVGAVLESHLLVRDYCDSLRNRAVSANTRIGVDLDEEKEYYSSGVISVKDSKVSYRLFEFWHQFWLESQALGLPIDLPNNCKSRPAVCAVYKRISVSSVERILKLPQTIFANAYIRRNKGVSESFRFTLFYLELFEILKLIRENVFDILDYCELRSSFRKSINELLQIFFFPLKLQLDSRRSVLYKSRELQKAYLLVDKRTETDPLNYSMNFYIRVLQGFSAPTAYFVN